MTAILWMVLAVLFAATLGGVLHPRRRTRDLTPAQRTAQWTLHQANLVAPLLRGGPTGDRLGRAVEPLRQLMATPGLAVADADGIIASAGPAGIQCGSLMGAVDAVLASGHPVLLSNRDLGVEAGRSSWPTAGVAAPLHVEDAVVGVLVAVDRRASADLLDLCVEVAQFVSGELETAESGHDVHGDDALDPLPVESGGRTLLIARSEVEWVESAGDYVRLHTFDDRSFLVRLSLGRLEAAWGPEGFARIHRRYLVCLRAVRELRCEGGQMCVEIPGAELPVSRRHIRQVKDLLVRHALSSR